jgi:ion channel
LVLGGRLASSRARRAAASLTTTGFGDITPEYWLTYCLVTAQILVGFFMTILIISRVVGYLPTPASIDPEEQPLGAGERPNKPLQPTSGGTIEVK